MEGDFKRAIGLLTAQKTKIEDFLRRSNTLMGKLDRQEYLDELDTAIAILRQAAAEGEHNDRE